jgi:hypothetical protein
MAWRMGHAIRDAAHAIMPRMLLVCAGSSVNVTRKSRVECRSNVTIRVVTTMNRGGNRVALPICVARL